MQKRTIRNDEALLIEFLLEQIPNKEYRYQIPSEVIEMDDGGMGSLLLNENKDRSFGSDLIQANYVDTDGIMVLITLVEDKKHNLFELDMWKVDNSPLKQFPATDKLFFS